MVRIQDLTQGIKTIAMLERVEAVHVAANCFRRGYDMHRLISGGAEEKETGHILVGAAGRELGKRV